MWPWEHLAFGYLLYSLSVRARFRAGVAGSAALALAAGTQFPDLVDKPLAWVLGVLPGSVFVHTLAVALPTIALIVLLAARFGDAETGIAFGVGYLSHIAGDMLYPALLGGDPTILVFLWPFAGEVTAAPLGVLVNVRYYLGEYLTFLQTPRGIVYGTMELVFLGVTLALWHRDGRPGIATVRVALRGAWSAVRPR